jgi:hypothetical protein
VRLGIFDLGIVQYGSIVAIAPGAKAAGLTPITRLKPAGYLLGLATSSD